MGTRRGKGGMKIDWESPSIKTSKASKSQLSKLNDGRGQEITGVTLPSTGQLKCADKYTDCEIIE